MNIPKRLMSAPLRRLLDVAGRAYVPGARLEDALKVASRLEGKGFGVTFGYFQGVGDSPLAVREATLSIIEAVSELDSPGYVSIKAPALRYDPELLASILMEARQRRILAHFDSHEHHTADATLECVQQAVTSGARVGVTLPGRWRRSIEDALSACRLGVRVRVVKGEWADPYDPVRDRRRGFMEVVECLAGRAREVAVATHDPDLARDCLSRLTAAGTRCELELLHGLPRRRLLPVAREFGVPVRIYVPFGIAWRPYALSKLRDNPRILWWLASDSLQGLYGILKH